jgi:hypothetical protein
VSGKLRRLLEDTIAQEGGTLNDWTVLDKGNDPFRVDTPAGHRDARWLATHAQAKLGDRTIHLRGFHYALIGERKPSGQPYANDLPTWGWLQNDPAKAARWLTDPATGQPYLPFERIRDARNNEPVVHPFEREPTVPFLLPGTVRLELPDELTPTIGIDGFEGVQPYRLVMVGEKTSLEPVLLPIATEHEADLYLPSGEISDTLIHRIARDADEDGRPLVVLYFTDSDPSGWQMPISLSRKLQALEALLFPGLEWEVRHVGLRPDQIGTGAGKLDLPSTPLKDSEKRADKWKLATGTEQTEIDALATLRPADLDRMARDAIAPFFDYDLAERVDEAREEWLAEAQEMLAKQLGPERLDEMREQAEAKLAELQEQVQAVNDGLKVDATGIKVPKIDVPDPEVDGADDDPLISSEWGFAEGTRALRARKRYEAP